MNAPIIRSNGSPEGNAFVAEYYRIAAEHRTARAAWLDQLAAEGILTAAPDDGWVNRIDNVWTPPVYCYRLSLLPIGALVALGDHDRYRVVRIISVMQPNWSGLALYGFEEVSRH